MRYRLYLYRCFMIDKEELKYLHNKYGLFKKVEF